VGRKNKIRSGVDKSRAYLPGYDEHGQKGRVCFDFWHWAIAAIFRPRGLLREEPLPSGYWCWSAGHVFAIRLAPLANNRVQTFGGFSGTLERPLSLKPF
jgi:hypothetical protein